jgi:hypothetical protein
MLRNILNWLIRHKNKLPLAVVVLVCLIVTGTSYQWGTYLSGWDTLHPEFNLSLYAERVFFGAWQEHQGLGAPASQAHAAELPRLFMIWLFDLILPQSAVRHAIFYFLYLTGVVGVYFFIKHAWFENKKDIWQSWSSALGALFFGLNLGTLQHFYVPLEMFAVHFATLPWLILVVWMYLKSLKRKYLLLFFLIQFLSSPSAHTATLFYMYTSVIFVFILVFSILKFWQNKKAAIKPVAKLFLLTIAAHLYWMIPNLYYIIFHSNYVQEAKISRHFSTEAFWQNQAYGSISNILIFKNFLFNWKDFDFPSSSFTMLFNEWERHLKSIIGYPLLFLNAILYLTGMGWTLKNFRRYKKEKLALLVLIFVPFFFLNNLNFPSEFIFGFIFKFSDTFREALRFPFTKFSIIFIFAASVYFAEFFSFAKHLIFKFVSKKNQLSFKYILVILGLVILLLPNLPALKGNLVSSSMKVEYPEYYFEMFEWFDQQDREGRIVKLPINDFFGWTYQNWPTDSLQGYQGAGFIWFGLQQPILDREFDRWVDKNEYFYTEIASAVKNNNPEKFNQALQKYQVSWLLFDRTALDPDKNAPDSYNLFTQLIVNNSSISLAQTFGPIEIYKFSGISNDWITSESFVTTNSQSSNLKYDPIYSDNGPYVLSPDTRSSVSYPFIDLLKDETALPIVLSETDIAVERQSGENFNNILIPPMGDFVKSIPVNIWVKMNPDGFVEFTLESILPEITVNNESIYGNELAPSKSILIPGSFKNFVNDYIFALNDTFVFFPYTEENLFLGSFILPTGGDTFSLYNAQPEEYFSFLNSQNLNINNCQNGANEPEVLRLEQIRSGVKIFSEDRVACVSDSSFRNIPNSGLLSVYFDYYSETKDTSTRLCIFENGGTGCLNSDSDYTFYAEKDSKQARVFEIIDKPTELNISYNLDGLGSNKQLTYSNAGAEFHPLLFSLPVSKLSLDELMPRETVLPLKEGSSLISVKQSFSKESEMVSLKSLSSLSSTANCGVSSGKVGFEAADLGHILSAEKKGVACETFSFNQLSPLQEYVLHTTATNRQGRELRLVVSDFENLILQEIYSPYETITKNILLNNQREKNRIKAEFLGDSFGDYQSINEINELALAPFPLEWVANFKVTNNNAAPTSSLNIVNSKRHFNFLYSAEIINPSQTKGVLQLSQSFDRLWIAFDMENPFNYLEHTMVNNWANGWLVSSGNHKIIIYYLPQISIFAGLIILLISSVGIFIYFKKEPKINILQRVLDLMKGHSR